MDDQSLPLCHSCGAFAWMSVPDSLAQWCTNCGAVVCEHDYGYRPGSSIQQWAADMADAMTRPDHTCQPKWYDRVLGGWWFRLVIRARRENCKACAMGWARPKVW